MNRPLRITHTEQNEDPAVTRERERLIKKFGAKRLKRIIRKYNQKKREMEMEKKERWLREQFRLSAVCCQIQTSGAENTAKERHNESNQHRDNCHNNCRNRGSSQSSLHWQGLRRKTPWLQSGKRAEERFSLHLVLVQSLVRLLPLLLHILEPLLLRLELRGVEDVGHVHGDQLMLVNAQVDLVHQLLLSV